MKNSEQPAHPINEESTDRVDAGVKIYTGLSKREYFAAMAMQGICATQGSDDKYKVNDGWLHPATVVKCAIEMADELLKQLES